MDKASKQALLAAARTALAEVIGASSTEPPATPGSTELSTPAGAFVSLHRGESLRGCIGTFDTSRPVLETVRQMAVAAATRDPRFPVVRLEELDTISIEISVLGAPRPARPEEISVGRHGLCVSRGPYRGVLLPQVATQYAWTTEEFLEQTCRKAGLAADAWRDPETQIEVFEAEVFAEATHREPGPS